MEKLLELAIANFAKVASGGSAGSQGTKSALVNCVSSTCTMHHLCMWGSWRQELSRFVFESAFGGIITWHGCRASRDCKLFISLATLAEIPPKRRRIFASLDLDRVLQNGRGGFV